MTGVIDVLSGINRTPPSLAELLPAGLLGQAIEQDELIIDYKGISKKEALATIQAAQHQLLLYGWLRNRHVGANVVRAGILVFVNDLLADASQVNTVPKGDDLIKLLKDSVEVVKVDDEGVRGALDFFDLTVSDIQSCRDSEAAGQSMFEAWEARPVKATCAAWDLRYECPKSLVEGAPNARPFSPAAP